MKITSLADIKEGHWLTFRSHYNNVITRKFYRIELIQDNQYFCTTYPRTETKRDRLYDTVVDRMYECPDDEVFETLEDCELAYPEEFI